MERDANGEAEPGREQTSREPIDIELRPLLVPLPNYTLSSVCPNCDAPVIRAACKVRCERCGFMWDCAEL